MKTVPQAYREQIMEALYARPHTLNDLLNIVAVARETLRGYLKALIKGGAIYVHRRQPVGPNKTARAMVFAIGSVANPLPSKSTDALVAYLRAHRNRSVAQLADAMDLSKYQVGRLIRSLRNGGAGMPKLYISGWTVEQFNRAPHYSIGNHADVPMPGQISNLEKSRRYQKRLQADPDRHERILARKRAKRMIQRVTKAHPDPLMAALFGMRPANNDDRMAA